MNPPASFPLIGVTERILIPDAQDGMDNQYIRRVARRGYIFTAPICRNTADGSEGNCPLWDGHIIDATFPPV
jgi:hypothetical protein